MPSDSARVYHCPGCEIQQIGAGQCWLCDRSLVWGRIPVVLTAGDLWRFDRHQLTMQSRARAFVSGEWT